MNKLMSAIALVIAVSFIYVMSGLPGLLEPAVEPTAQAFKPGIYDMSVADADGGTLFSQRLVIERGTTVEQALSLIKSVVNSQPDLDGKRAQVTLTWVENAN